MRATFDSSHVSKNLRTQGILRLLGVQVLNVKRGTVELTVKNRPALSQQDGFVHAGVLATLLDSAGGYAVLSLLPQGSRVLAVEFKINFMRPAIGDVIHATGKVRKLGKKIAICELEARTRQRRKWVPCAWGSQTVYCIRPDATND